jgi:hypothetical protein
MLSMTKISLLTCYYTTRFQPLKMVTCRQIA